METRYLVCHLCGLAMYVMREVSFLLSYRPLRWGETGIERNVHVAYGRVAGKMI